jgi:hypothetical protein
MKRSIGICYYYSLESTRIGQNQKEPRGMKMKVKGSWQYALIVLVAMCLALPPSLFSQGAPAKTFKQEELDQLLAPIALYPDDVLAQILMASTYPLEIVQADRWVKQNKSLKGDAQKAALEKQTWDNSVKSLVPFPDVLAMMSDKLDWTQKLGDAFLEQEKDVMDTVQKLRRKANEAGNLKSSSELAVKKEADIIIIEPANPQVIYVPSYNPTVVYGAWPYPAYPPYPVYAYPPGAAMFTFAMGVAVGAAWYHGWGNCNWNGGTVNVNKNVNINRPASPGTRPGGGGGGERWQHNPEHRKGVSYRDQATRDKYQPTNRAAVDNRQGNRGYEKPSAGTADRSGGRQPSQAQGNKPDRSGAQAKSRDNAFAGTDRSASQVSRDSARGSQSMSSSKSGGGGGSSGGASRGGGGRGGRR